MPLIYECDECGTQLQSRKTPSGWKYRWASDAVGQSYECTWCQGITPSNTKPAKRRAKEIITTTAKGPLFGDEK